MRTFALLVLASFTPAFATYSKDTAKKKPSGKPPVAATNTAKKVKKRKASRKTKKAQPVVTPKQTTQKIIRPDRVFIPSGPWKEPTFADSTFGDKIDGEEIEVRRAAVAALGRYNGSVVVSDPQSGRILTMVNQKLALKSGFQPCSTIKLVTAFGALSEGLIERDTPLRLGPKFTLTLTNALAHSSNPFFASLGIKLGFERVVKYARMFGLGEKAGWNINGEQPGTVVSEPPRDGVGMMTSFGSGISLTPLQLSALLGAIANGGSLYYLQCPKNQAELAAFAPQLKRKLQIDPFIPAVKTGMRAVVDRGTGRRANYDPEEPILGKTGTCTDSRSPTHLGWFGSFNEVGDKKLVVVVLLTGGKPVNGPVAAGIAGNVYRNLSQDNFFARAMVNTELVSTQNCCAQ